jgi:hypothetical protein
MDISMLFPKFLLNSTGTALARGRSRLKIHDLRIQIGEHELAHDATEENTNLLKDADRQTYILHFAYIQIARKH